MWKIYGEKNTKKIKVTRINYEKLEELENLISLVSGLATGSYWASGRSVTTSLLARRMVMNYLIAE